MNIANRKAIGLILSLTLSSFCYANPEGGVVTAGNATISQPTPTSTEIQQQSAKAIIDWHSFNIASNESVHFQQPTDGIALNRIDSAQGVSQIFGKLTATGKIVLVNQAGIYFGPTARVDVGSLIASVANISNENFLAGKLTFDQISAATHGAIINDGIITAAQYGLIALVGPGVVNNGTIRANVGKVVLASGNKYTMDFYGDDLIYFAVEDFVIDEATTAAAVDQNGKSLKNGVHNTSNGKIEAPNGSILIAAKNAPNILDNAINMEGIAQANSVSMYYPGEIILSGGDQGQVKVSGKIEASGYEKQGIGGYVDITGRNIDITSSAIIDVNGNNDGGVITIGGQERLDFSKSTTTSILIEPFAKLLANAVVDGHGGAIALSAEDSIKAYGNFSVRGGTNSGDGGAVFLLSKHFNIDEPILDLHAPHGSDGIIVGMTPVVVRADG